MNGIYFIVLELLLPKLKFAVWLYCDEVNRKYNNAD